jgi:hypothetical protein
VNALSGPQPQLAGADDLPVSQRRGHELEAVLRGFAHITYKRRRDGEMPPSSTATSTSSAPEQRLHDLVRGAIVEAAAIGAVRDDVSPDELADYCLHALGAAGGLPSEAAVWRLVGVTLAGLRLADRSGSTDPMRVHKPSEVGVASAEAIKGADGGRAAAVSVP